jgi:hypothetical protein
MMPISWFLTLIIGDNFIVLVDLNNFEGVNFFLLQCVKHMEIV